MSYYFFFFFSSRRRHTRFSRDWSSDVCSSDLVGLGWTGGILGKELAAAGLKVVALERGEMRTTADDYSLPNIRDELRYVVRQELMMNTARDTLTIRNNPSQEALPMRRLGS